MEKSRSSIFDEEDNINLEEFSIKKENSKNFPSKKEVEEVAKKVKFSSREPSKVTNLEKPLLRRYRTGRNVQINIKVSKETSEAFYAIADSNNWVLGETFEYAVKALYEKLSNKK